MHATFGPRARWAGPAADDDLPAPLAEMPASRPAAWSPSRGIHKDPLHVDYLGPSGRVPEEFLDFGPVAAGQAVHLRAVIQVERALSTFSRSARRRPSAPGSTAGRWRSTAAGTWPRAPWSWRRASRCSTSA